MKRVALTLALIVGWALPGLAQDHGLYAPCLAGRSVADMEAAFATSGWRIIEDEAARDAALRSLAEGYGATHLLPAPFENAAEAAEFVEAAIEAFGIARHQLHVFGQGDLVATIDRFATTRGEINATCLIAAAASPEIEALLQDDIWTIPLRRSDRLALVTAGEARSPAAGEVRDVQVFVYRLDGAPLALPVLTGRYGVLVSRVFAPAP